MGSAATMGVYMTAISVIFSIMALVAAAFLLSAYLRTRISGLLWLLVAVVVWPILARISYPVVGWLMSSGAGSSGQILGMPANLGVVVLQTAVSSLVSGVLLIIASASLYRQLTQRTGENLPVYPASYAGIPQPYAPPGQNRPTL